MVADGMYDINLARLRDYAETKGWMLNPDGDRVRKVVGLMTQNLADHGNYFCPCKLGDKTPVEGTDVVCPCPEVDEEIAEKGHCYCRLLFAEKRTD